jgi:hypothetical protein
MAALASTLLTFQRFGTGSFPYDVLRFMTDTCTVMQGLSALSLVNASTLRAADWQKWSFTAHVPVPVDRTVPGIYKVTTTLTVQLLFPHPSASTGDAAKGVDFLTSLRRHYHNAVNTTKCSQHGRDIVLSYGSELHGHTEASPDVCMVKLRKEQRSTAWSASTTGCNHTPVTGSAAAGDGLADSTATVTIDGGQQQASAEQALATYWSQVDTWLHGTVDRDTSSTTSRTAKKSSADDELVLHRRVFDSRRSKFTVLTTVRLPSVGGNMEGRRGAAGKQQCLTSSGAQCEPDSAAGSDNTCSSTARTTFTEVLADHHDIDLRSYTYEILLAEGGTADHGDAATSLGNTLHVVRDRNSGYVVDLPGFQWSAEDCTVHQPIVSAFGGITSHLEQRAIEWYGMALTRLGLAYSTNARMEGKFRNIEQQQQLYRTTHHLYAYNKRGGPAEQCYRTLNFELPPLPQNSTLVLAYSANKRFITREYQPTDASRGAQVPPSYLTLTGRVSEGLPLRVYTGSYVVTTTIPDASMPFNVITLVRYAWFTAAVLSPVVSLPYFQFV